MGVVRLDKSCKDRIKQALRHSNAEYCEVRIEETERTNVSFRGKDIDQVSDSTAVGGNVRALYRGGWGFASFNRLLDLDKKVEEACAQASLLGDRLNKDIKLYPVDPIEDEVPGTFPTPAFMVPLEEKVRILAGYNSLVLSQPEITSSMVRYFDQHTHLYYGNTDNTFIYQEKVDLGGGIVAIASKGTLTTQEIASFGSNRDFGTVFGHEDDVRRITATARDMLYAPVVEAGQYTVVLSPEMAGVFVHEAFGHLSEADSLDEDEPMKELLKIGTRYGSDDLDIYDSGLLGGNRGESKYDDEGVPMQKTYLIKGGVVAGHLHGRESAWKMGEKPTGNARALSYRYPPIVRMRTTCIGPGKDTLDEMIKGTPLGVYVGGSYGGQTNGEMFTFAATSCRMIRNGVLAEAVRDVNLAGNVFTTLRNIDAIGDDFTVKNSPGGCGKGMQGPLPVAMGSPHIRIRNVVIGGEKR